MQENNKPYVNAKEISSDFDISLPKAYQIIKTLNNELKKAHPTAIILAGKVNRIWYEAACLKNSSRKEDEK